MACISDSVSSEKGTACRRCKLALLFSVILLWMFIAILLYKSVVVQREINKMANLKQSASFLVQGLHFYETTRLTFADMKGEYLVWKADLKGDNNIALTSDGKQVEFLQDQRMHIRVKLHIDTDLLNSRKGPIRSTPNKLGFSILLFKSDDTTMTGNQTVVSSARGKMLLGTADDREFSELLNVTKGNTVYVLLSCEEGSHIVRSGIMDISLISK